MGLAAKLGTTVVLLCWLVAPPVSAEKLKTFSDEFRPIFAVEQPATINNDALRVTPDSASGDFNLTYLSGRVMFRQPFKLWDGSSNRTGSFNSSFLVNLVHLNSTPGEGLAFVVSSDLNLPPNSYGQCLGLTNSTTDGIATNRQVAVELDSFKEDFDPDANHNASFYNVWVQYDGVNMVIEVYIAQQETKSGPTLPMPATPVLRSDLDLRGVVDQYSYFGFSASTSNARQLNSVLRWNLTVNYYTDHKQSWIKILLVVGVPMLVLVLIGLLGLVCFLNKRRMARNSSNILGTLKSLQGTSRKFQFKDLKKAINNFDEKNKVGMGGSGVVYRGYLQNEKLEIAVKMFSTESRQSQDEFLAEVTILSRLRHKHIVRSLGWCHKNGKLLLVYDYMPNGSLDKHLHEGADRKLLTWNLRYKIISGVASALHHLHNKCNQRVVHRDLKPSNIMLDSDFNARLGGFGLALLYNEETSSAETVSVAGTMGFIAPECFHTSEATQQSDVYGFGAVLLEVVCGLRIIDIGGLKNFIFEHRGLQTLEDWVWFLPREGRLVEAVDERLRKDYVVEEAQRILLLGLACMHPTPYQRPKTQDILQMISGSVPVPHVPPFKPPFKWPPMLMGDDDTSHASTASCTTSNFGSGGNPQCIMCRHLSRLSYGRRC